MFNKVILVGNLTRDPELRYLPSGSAVCNTAIATNRRYKTQSGEQKEEVCFIDITLFGRTAEIANQYLTKGKKVLIEGRLKLEQWTDQNGNKRSKHAVTVETMQMLGSKNDEQEGQVDNQGNYSQSGGNYGQSQSNQNYGGGQSAGYQEPQNGGGYGQQQAAPKPQQNPYGGHQQNLSEYDINDDEIPF